MREGVERVSRRKENLLRNANAGQRPVEVTGRVF